MNPKIELIIIESLMSDVAQELIERVGGTSMVKASRKSKINRFAGTTAMAIAKSKNDPLYHRYVRFNKLRKKLKAQLNKKYGARSRTHARASLGKN